MADSRDTHTTEHTTSDSHGLHDKAANLTQMPSLPTEKASILGGSTGISAAVFANQADTYINLNVSGDIWNILFNELETLIYDTPEESIDVILTVTSKPTDKIETKSIISMQSPIDAFEALQGMSQFSTVTGTEGADQIYGG